MGYTNYFYVHKDGIPAAAWKLILSDVRTLIANLPAHSINAGGYHSDDPLEIAYEHDSEKPPLLNPSRIRFNGKDGDNDLGHETFILERKPTPNSWQSSGPKDMVFACCKTARKPYDIVVCGALIVARAHAGKLIDVSSDGDIDDWLPALQWVASTLHPAAKYWGAFAEIFNIQNVPEAHTVKNGCAFIDWLKTTGRLGALEYAQVIPT